MLLKPEALAPLFSSSSPPFPRILISGLGTLLTLNVSLPSKVPPLLTFNVTTEEEGTTVTFLCFHPQ
ncbi:hypothetical protein ACFFJX_20490 [Pseudarcicella hirudinis]|uniref:hypothetical protein n=1 Tax=Pseudarcicella hirudinis TaxID=1079859 RepID=UPI0035E689B1